MILKCPKDRKASAGPRAAAGVTDHVWSLEEIAALSQPVAPTKRGPYRRTTPGV